MHKSAKSRAEDLFAATLKKPEKILNETEKAALDRAERTARLKALRLTKEADDKAAAKIAAMAR